MAGAKRTRDEQREDFHVEDVIDRPFDRGLASRLLRYALPYRRRVLTALGLILLTSGLGLLSPLFVKEAIDGPLAPDGGRESSLLGGIAEFFGLPGGADEGDRQAILLLIVALYGCVLLTQAAARYLQMIVMDRTGQSVMRDLRVQVFEHLQRQSMAFFQRHPVGRLVTRLTSDIEALNELFTSGVVAILGDVLTLAGIVVILFWSNVELAFLTLAITPFLIGVTILFRTMSRRHFREIRRRIAHLGAYTQESITGLGVVQITRQEEARAAGYERINERYLGAHLKSIFWYAFFFPAVELLSAIALATITTYSGSRIMAGTMTFGEFFLFWSYLTKFFEPVRDLAEKYNVLQAAMAASERIFGLLDEDTSVPRAARVRAPAPLQECIRFEDVHFSYDGDKSVLDGVSFEIRRGEKVALVGATGAGKSTVIQLLLRFYDPTAGRILIDGHDLREFDPQRHRARFGLVLQDVSVFSRTVLENIDLDRDLPRRDLESAAERVHAAAFARRLPDGFDSVLRERGSNLSSGERQLLSFARALAGGPEILVLDEATSHVDSDTEQVIEDALRRLVRGRTSVIVAHRLSTIRNADRILVFHHGRLREEGRHRELLARGDIYARLHRLQFDGGDGAPERRQTPGSKHG